jgi:hypothetical protein
VKEDRSTSCNAQIFWTETVVDRVRIPLDASLFLTDGLRSTRRTTRLARTTRRLVTRRAIGSTATLQPAKRRARNEAPPRLPLRT